MKNSMVKNFPFLLSNAINAETSFDTQENLGSKNSNTKPTFYKKKQRAKAKAARKANLLMRKNKK